MKEPKASASGPFDPARKEQLRVQLVDLLKRQQSEQSRTSDVVERLLVALIGALEDPR